MFARRSILAAPLVLLAPPKVHAAASAWSRDQFSAIRLIAGGMAGEGHARHHLAGLHMTLVGNTKTYWRTPGDSGVPPVFDWERSTNLASVDVAWPAPLRFSDGSGFSIGYKREVVFPLAVRALDWSRPVELALNLDYAVCDTLCIPAKGQSALRLTPGVATEPALAELLSRHASRVPQAHHPALGIAVLSASRIVTPPRVIFAVRGPAGQTLDLFAEGPDHRWALPLPEPLPQDAGLSRFGLTLDGIPRGVNPFEHALTLTLVAGDEALETTLPLG